MYASGSTWAYNVMRAIAEPARGRFVNTLADLAGIDDGHSEVVKSHDLAPDVAAALLAHTPRIVATIRDPRDAMSSLMLYQHYPRDLARATIVRSALFVADIAARPETLLLRYEDRFPDNPATIPRIAAAMGIALSAETAVAIHVRFRRSAVERVITGLDTLPSAIRDPHSGDVFDPLSQWHKHHAGRTGEIGRWVRALRSRDARAIEHDLAAWMHQFRYLNG